MTLSALGDSAVVISLGDRVDPAVGLRVRAIAAEIERHPPAGVVDVVAAFASVAVFYDCARGCSFAQVCAELEKLAARADAVAVNAPPRRVEIPVCYSGEFAPDLDLVARHTGLTAADVVALHSGATYVVHAIGFAPGFPYLGGLPEKLATPRRATPRATVPAGAVGIGGAQTGIYPLATPGGWNVIGRTPLSLFDPARKNPALLRAGDEVTFRAITRDEFARFSAEDALTRSSTGMESPTVWKTEKRDATPERRGTLAGAAVAAAGVDVGRPGMLTTVQDPGRIGHRAQGVPLSGAADPFALRVANLLVGNSEDAAALECTLVGPELTFRRDTVVALTGADFGIERWRPFHVRAGETLNLGAARNGCRGYVAFAGGIDIAPTLGSRSTYLRAQFGGFGGRALRAGDVLPVTPVMRDVSGHWRMDERIVPAYSEHPVVRVIAGVHADQFPRDWTQAEFVVTPKSDRMGVGLSGGRVLRTNERDLVSTPVAPGTVQVPPDGQPIVLLADAQTIGGYPQIAHVISVDLPLIGQVRPGDRVRFRAVTLDEAHDALLARERALGMLREGIAQKLA